MPSFQPLTLVIIIAACICGYLFFIAPEEKKLESNKEEMQTLEQTRNKLQQETKTSEDRVAKLKNDPRAVEHVAREKSAYCKPNEEIYTLPTPIVVPMAPASPEKPVRTTP